MSELRPDVWLSLRFLSADVRRLCSSSLQAELVEGRILVLVHAHNSPQHALKQLASDSYVRWNVENKGKVSSSNSFNVLSMCVSSGLCWPTLEHPQCSVGEYFLNTRRGTRQLQNIRPEALLHNTLVSTHRLASLLKPRGIILPQRTNKRGAAGSGEAQQHFTGTRAG